MPGRNASSGDYRYGFNGKEMDNEVKSITGTSYDFGGRSLYDGRIGRFISIDPRYRDFPGMSPYAYGANNPIYYLDENGEGPFDFLKNLYEKAKQIFIKKAAEIAYEITVDMAEVTAYAINEKYEDLKQEVGDQGNSEYKASAKLSIPVGIFGEEEIKVLNKGTGGELDIFSTDLFSIEVGGKFNKEGYSSIFKIDYPGNGEGVKIRNSASYTQGVLSFSAKNEFTVTDIDAGAKGVKGKSQTFGGSIGSVGSFGVEQDFVKNRTTESLTLFKGGFGLGIGIRGSTGVSVSHDTPAGSDPKPEDSPVPTIPKD